jgi:hypothetical protein
MFKRTSGLSIAVLALTVASSCAVRPVKNDRKGMFDGLDESPGAARVLSSEDKTISVTKMPPASITRLAFGWPLKDVEITSKFGYRGDGVHEGIDLRAPVGTPVYASQAGLVLHSGSQISGYGKMVVLRHEHGWATIYAHNSKLLVRSGARVKKGQLIAYSGKTGRASGPHVHFEVRNGVTAYDPVSVLVAGASRPAPAASRLASTSSSPPAAREVGLEQKRAEPKRKKTQSKFRTLKVAQRDRMRTTQAAPGRKPSSRSKALKGSGKKIGKTVGGKKKSGRKPQSIEGSSSRKEKHRKPQHRRYRGKRAVASAGEPG